MKRMIYLFWRFMGMAFMSFWFGSLDSRFYEKIEERRNNAFATPRAFG